MTCGVFCFDVDTKFSILKVRSHPCNRLRAMPTKVTSHARPYHMPWFRRRSSPPSCRRRPRKPSTRSNKAASALEQSSCTLYSAAGHAKRLPSECRRARIISSALPPRGRSSACTGTKPGAPSSRSCPPSGLVGPRSTTVGQRSRWGTSGPHGRARAGGALPQLPGSSTAAAAAAVEGRGSASLNSAHRPSGDDYGAIGLRNPRAPGSRARCPAPARSDSTAPELKRS